MSVVQNIQNFVRKEPVRKVLLWVWFLTLLAVAIWDGNWNAFWSFVLFYLFVWVLFDLQNNRRIPNSRTRLHSFINWCRASWSPVWIVVTLSLFIVGNGPLGFIHNINQEHYKILSYASKTGALSTSQYAFHVPVVERVTNWREDYKMDLQLTAETSDGKLISADLFVDLWLVDGITSAENAASKFGTRSKHRKAIEQVIADAFSESVSQHSLETMPSALILEDLVSTTINLEGLDVFLSGVIRIDDIHRTRAED